MGLKSRLRSLPFLQDIVPRSVKLYWRGNYANYGKTPRGRDTYERVRAIKYTHFGANTVELPL